MTKRSHSARTAKPTTAAATKTAAAAEPTPSAATTGKTSGQVEVVLHSLTHEIVARRDEVAGGVTTVHLEVGPVKEPYPAAAYPTSEEVSPDVGDGEDQPAGTAAES